MVLGILILLDGHIDQSLETIRRLRGRDVGLGTALLRVRLVHVYSALKTVRKVIHEIIRRSAAPLRGLSRNLGSVCHIREWPH